MIYLNNAATSFPKPESVIQAVNDYNRGLPFHAMRSDFSDRTKDIVSDVREKLRHLFNAECPDQIILTSGATHSLNLIIRGVLEKSDHVVTSWTEHNSVLRLLKTLEKKGFIQLSLVECDKRGVVRPEQISSALRDDTKAVIVNHCSNVTGAVQDLKKIGTLISGRDVFFIVDGSQSAGHMDIDIKEAKVDAFAFTGHKGLFGMQGTGGIYIGDRITPEPLMIGGTGVKSDYLYQPTGKPAYYEAGTPNMPGIVSLDAGVSFVLQEGMQAAQNKKKFLKDIVLEAFLDHPQILVYGGETKEDFDSRSSIISFNIRGFSPSDTGYILEHGFEIICRSGLHCAPLIHQALGSYPEGSVRVSFSQFNCQEDAEALISAVFTIAKGRKRQ